MSCSKASDRRICCLRTGRVLLLAHNHFGDVCFRRNWQSYCRARQFFGAGLIVDADPYATGEISGLPHRPTLNTPAAYADSAN